MVSREDDVEVLGSLTVVELAGELAVELVAELTGLSLALATAVPLGGIPVSI